MILNFHNKTTEDIYDGLDSKAARRIPASIWKTAVRKLDMINSAFDLRDLRNPTANKLELLKGKMSGYYSIRINDQYRIIFQWIDHNAKNVSIIDYH